jgi:UDP-2,4-diacetamido-2,4,6-trideoxy-beta-L-altropyranose hydrolase
MIPGSQPSRSLLFRADASVSIGTGHVMRCLALAQAWQDAGGRAVFAMAESTPAIQMRLAAESCEVMSISSPAGTAEDARQTIGLAREQKSDWVVVDGYHFTADYQRALKDGGLKLLFLDDYGHAQNYSADLVLNQNVSAGESLYANREPQTRLLLGTRYCLLRRQFAAWRNWQREVLPECRRILVTMGGSDPENLTARVIEALALARLESVEATVVIGGSNPHFARLQSLATRSGGRITMRRDVSNMAEQMAASDVAVSAAGSTCWELCLLGLPALLIDVADNQTEVARELDRRGCAIHVGDRTVTAGAIADRLNQLVFTRDLRLSLSKRSRELVDGEGALRVVSVLRGANNVRLRGARPDDVRLLWEWANDPEVRAASFSSAPIPWETHVAWFAEKIDRSGSLIFIAEDEGGTPFGQIRFDLKGGEAELNLSLAKEKRGMGLAVPLIEAGTREILGCTECERVHAYVKPQNAASARAFERAGFVRVGVEQVREHIAVHFICVRSIYVRS